jgi:uncharacterized protein YbbC (DUF1343 family)
MVPRITCQQLALAIVVAISGLPLMTASAPSQTPTPLPVPGEAPITAPAPTPARSVMTGAELLVASHFQPIAGKRVGLIANQTARVRGQHLADLLSRAPNVKLAAIFAPEHGFRGTAEAGATLSDGVDTRTGVAIYSLYGASKAPAPSALRNIDVLVFDIQDIGARFYTYISTMGLAMQAAAAARIPFLVLDRPNPLGGDYVSGFVLEPQLRSFVGQYPIPIVHGLTVGELAHMIKGEKWLDGLEHLDLSVIKMQGWQRGMRWPQAQHGWVATSPNIPTFASALVYPGMGLVGETEVSEGRGTPTPFCVFGAPWLDATRVVARLNALSLHGVRFETATFTPRSIAGVATRPRFADTSIDGTRLLITDVAQVEPLELGIHVLSLLVAEARSRGVSKLFGNLAMFHAIAGTKRLYRMLASGSSGAEIIAAWQGELAQFKAERGRYLLY